ncbi:hypothetical protein RCCRONUS_30 [Rhodobacter phage RcCronus]|nr:hypothetical protein RCRHEA_30 [Rhodobacter phage RcRhea]YP_009616320.1 hypothetical protein FDI78_gp30 [Rhodobacter phage RcCronus]AKU43274.1 hypothetical protein RCRHEA_30 [Rhodobacter phage RcRhea]AKU43319.1 hypothetical protein RCCRONUS_30 [Rhodobacter phage RcCronus]
MNKPFEQSATEIRAAIAAKAAHPGSLVGLAQNRIMRLREWSPGDLRDRLTAEAVAVLDEGKALCAELHAANAAR